MSEEEIEDLEKLGSSVASTMAGVSIGILVL